MSETCPKCGSHFRESHSPRNASGEVRYTTRWFACGSTETTESDGNCKFKQVPVCRIAQLTAQLAEETKGRTNAEFELLALRDEVAKLKRPITGEELRIDAAEVELRAEMLADEGEELTVPLRDYNELSRNSLALDAEWRAKFAALTSRCEAAEKERDVRQRAVERRNLALKENAIIINDYQIAITAAEKRAKGFVDGLTQLKSDIHCTIDQYERNGPTWTSRGGTEMYNASYVLEKAAELEASVDALLAAGEEANDVQVGN